ncbi:MAG: hypothetical protein ABI680_10860 [Chthoniobacteraceae bacterium]
MENPPVLIAEPNVPSGHWPFPLLEISAWPSWNAVAGFVATLWADALAEGADTIVAEAARLRAETGSAETAARAAITLVQEEIRYLAVDFGHGAGMLPAGAGSVMRRRFGDCKDKTVLLRTRP